MTIDKNLLKIFLQSMTAKMLEAGELAIAFQGKVPNLKKDTAVDANASQRIKDRSQAKTEIDEKVQEILLTCVKETLGTENIKIDAEEDTPSKDFFQSPDPFLTVVIDPIDGTLEYLEGSDGYSLNVGLIKDGQVITTLIYFPKLKKLYYLDINRKPYEVTYNQKLVIESKKELTQPQVIQSEIVYTNNRVSETAITNLRKIGITVVEDDGNVSWPESSLKCLSGEFGASIFHTPHTRDILLGALIESLPNGFMVNWQGEKIPWPDGGRIPRVIFGVGKLSPELIHCLV